MPKQTEKTKSGFFKPFKISTVPWEDSPKKGKIETRYQVLGRFGGGAKVGVGIDELPPGAQSNEFHYHMLEEEHIMIMEGSATLLLGDEEIIMEAGDFCTFPAGQRAGHCLVNHTDKICKFLTIGDNNPHDVYVYPKLKKVKSRVTGETYDLP